MLIVSFFLVNKNMAGLELKSVFKNVNVWCLEKRATFIVQVSR